MVLEKRNSSFELLRIVSMLLIVMHHYTIHGGFDFNSQFTFRMFFVQILQIGGKIGVNLFVLISGYFLCKSTFKWEKIFKLEFQVLFYSIIIGVVFLFFFPDLQIKILNCFFPLYSNMYWFYSAYLFLILLSPYINKLINSIEKKEFQNLLKIIIILWVVIPIIPKVDALSMSELGWFIFLYLCSAYIRLYGEDFYQHIRTYFHIGVICYILLLGTVWGFDLLGLFNSRFKTYFGYFGQMNSFFTFFCSVFIFIGFSKLKIRYNFVINLIASTTFGIYLLHDNPFVRKILWDDIFNNKDYLYTNKIFLHSFITIMLVFIICVIIDLVRQYVFEKPLLLVLEKIKIMKKKNIAQL